MTVKNFLKDEVFKEDGIRMRAYCKDGFNVSIQQSRYHYCNNDNEVELGFPSEKEQLLVKYAENKKNLCDTVYGYVPIDLIEAIVKKHGGIDKKLTIKNNK